MAEKSTGILALLGSPKGEPGGGEEESAAPAQQAAEDASRAMWAAQKTGDAAGFVDAYKDLKKACEALTESSELEETEPGEEY